MPNSYANLGSSIGNILSRAGGTRSAIPAGHAKGMDSGSTHMLRSAQTNKTMADTDRIMYELSQAMKGDNTTAGQIAAGLGVPDHMVQAQKMGESSIPNLNPAIPSAPIPQDMKDKYTNATTLKILQQLSGGTQSGANASTLMDVLGKGQDLGIMSNMQGGQQNPVDIARFKAAMEGEFPGTVGGSSGKMPAAKVQEVNDMIGKGIPQNKALEAVYGSPSAKRYTDAYTRVYALTFDQAAADHAGKQAQKQGGKDYLTGKELKNAPPNIVKVYK